MNELLCCIMEYSPHMPATNLEQPSDKIVCVIIVDTVF